MIIELPQLEPGQTVLTTLEYRPVNLSITLMPTDPEEMVTEVTSSISSAGNPMAYMFSFTQAGVISLTGQFQEIFDQQTFRVLDWKVSEGVYVIPKVYTTYNNLGDTEADLNWDNIIAFTPDPRASVDVIISGTVTTEKLDPESVLPPPNNVIETVYNYSFKIVVQQDFDRNKPILEELVARGATE